MKSILLLAILAADPSLSARFSRALRAFEEARYADAIVDFEALEAARPTAIVRYNLAFCHARAGHPKEALVWLSRFEPIAVPQERRAALSELRATQEKLIARVEVTTGSPVAGILEVDGQPVETSLPTTIELNPGLHNVVFSTEGFLPSRRPLQVAAGEHTALKLTLLRSTVLPSRLRVNSSLPGVEIRIDEVPLAVTPVPTALQLKPGVHSLVATRAGYQPSQRSISFAEGAEETVIIDLEPLVTSSNVVVEPSEPEAIVQIDGRRVTPRQPVRLPGGRHRLQVERDGFLPLVSEFEVADDAQKRVTALLEPNPQTLALLSQRRGQHRLWGWTAAGVGAATVIVSVIGLVLNARTLETQGAAFREAKSLCDAFDPAGCRDLGQLAPSYGLHLDLQTAGFITAGAGLALSAVAGVVLGLAPNLDRYERGPGPSDLVNQSEE